MLSKAEGEREEMPAVLLQEADLGTRGFVKVVLEDAGFVVLQTAEGSDLLDRYRIKQTDAVIVGFPSSDGKGLATIKRLTSEFPHAVVIMLAADFEWQRYVDVRPLVGARRTLPKPLSGGDLVNALQEELGISALSVT